jgi:hypothetical protein
VEAADRAGCPRLAVTVFARVGEPVQRIVSARGEKAPTDVIVEAPAA